MLSGDFGKEKNIPAKEARNSACGSGVTSLIKPCSWLEHALARRGHTGVRYEIKYAEWGF